MRKLLIINYMKAIFGDEEDDKKFISEDEKRPTESRSDIGIYNTQKSKCPECGSYNTYETTYVEGCNTCGWSFGYY